MEIASSAASQESQDSTTPTSQSVYQSALSTHRMPCLSQFLGLMESSSECGYCPPKKTRKQRKRKIGAETTLLSEDGNDSSKEISVPGSKPKISTTISQFLTNCAPHIYDAIMNKNWRRCGDYFYFPKNDITCCPQYAIRLDVRSFQLEGRGAVGKKQRGVWNKMGRYLEVLEQGRDMHKEHEQNEISTGTIDDEDVEMKDSHQEELNQKYQQELDRVRERVLVVLRSAITKFSLSRGNLISQIPQFESQDWMRDGLQPSNRKNVHLASNAMIKLFGMAKKNKLDLGFKSVSDLTHSFVDNVLRNESTDSGILSVEATKNGWINFQLDRMPAPPPIADVSITGKEFKKKAKSSSSKKHTSEEVRRLIDNGLEVTLSRAKYDEEEFQLYKKYQMAVHKDPEDEITSKGYTRFLIESTLVPVSDARLPFGGYGTFHMQYRVEKTKQLIGVSVVDILPTGWSSVYFFYDPSFSFLSPGVFSVLYEIDMLKEMCKKHPDFKYLYLGFYIHTCQKMRYKGEYGPSELLCPETHTWVPLSTATKVLDKAKYGRFQPDPSVPRYDANINHADDLLLLVDRSLIPAKFLLQEKNFMQTEECETLTKELLLFKRTVGEHSAKEIAYYVSSLG